MIPLLQSNRKLQYFFIALLLASLAIAQSAYAVISEPAASDANSNASEESNALSEDAAASQAANQPPNHPIIPINLIRFVPVPCAGENVKMEGELRLHFRNENGKAKPESAALVGFVGTGKRTNRTYRANSFVNDESVNLEAHNGRGSGTWTIRFHVVGNPNPPPKGDPNPGKVFRFKLQYTVKFKFENGKVTQLNAVPAVVCN